MSGVHNVRQVAATRNDSNPPLLLEYRSSTWFIVTTICVASFTDAFIYGVIIPVLPNSLRERSGVSEEDVQFWNSLLLASFGAAQFLGSPLFGWWADHSSSRRTPLLLGFISCAAATTLLCFATNLWLLVVSRFLQGLSAGIVYTVGLALLSDTVGSKDMGQWMGYVITTLNVGMLVAPSVGGIIYESAGYYSVFAVTLGLIVLDILLRLIMVEKKVAAKWRTPTTPEPHGKTTDFATIRSDVQAPIDQPDSSSRPQITETTGLLDAEGLRNQADSLSSELHDSSTSREPLRGSKTSPRDSATATTDRAQQTSNQAGLIPPLLTLLGSPRVLTNLYGVMVTVTLLVAFDSALPLFVERTFGWGPTGQGLIFLAITLPIFAAPIAGKLSDMYPTRLLTSLWFLLSALFTLLLLLVTHRGMSQVVMLCVFLSLYGMGHRLIGLTGSVLVPLTDGLVASARVFGASPLGADLNRAVDELERDRPGILGESGAKAQVFSLYTSASAAGVLIGPAWTSYAYGERNWIFLVSSLAVLNASVVVPVMLFFPSKRQHKGDAPGKYPVDGRSGDVV